MTSDSSPSITREKLLQLDEFLVNWYTENGWPNNAPLSVPERNLVSLLLWQETEITWLRVLGTVLNPASERQYLESSLFVHFNAQFPQDVERMFEYWIQSRHLRKYGKVLLQTYFAVKSGANYPALTAVVPLAETVLEAEGIKERKYKVFYEKFSGGVGVKIAETFTKMLYEQVPRGGIENIARYNRHRLAHGISPTEVTPLDVASGCLILDMVVSTIETGGNLLDRVLR